MSHIFFRLACGAASNLLGGSDSLIAVKNALGMEVFNNSMKGIAVATNIGSGQAQAQG